MKVGRKIYYDSHTGNILVDTGERQGNVSQTTVKQDIQTYKSLSERNRDTFDYIELEYGQYAQDFAESNGYRVNPETKELEFSYPDPNEEEPQEPVYQKPLSEEVSVLKQENQMLKQQVSALGQQGEMLEGAIVELALMTLE